MLRYFLPLVLSSMGILGPHAASAAFDGDLVPRLIGTNIITDGLSDLDGSTQSNISVFQYSFGGLLAGFASDPGFQPQAGSGLPPGSLLGFNVAGPLLYWNGTGTIALAPAGTHQEIQLYLGASHVEITGVSPAMNGFPVALINAQGATHRHLNAQALGAPDPDGDYVDGQGNSYNPPADGIYAFPIVVTDAASSTTSPASYVSSAKWLVYNQNLSDQQLTDAADAIQLGTQGDADLSGTVDLLDFDVWFHHLGEDNSLFYQGDFDGSGIVDLLDFDTWFSHLGFSRKNMTRANAVPEPASLAIFASAAVLFLALKRR